MLNDWFSYPLFSKGHVLDKTFVMDIVVDEMSMLKVKA